MIDKALLDKLFQQAAEHPRQRMNLDLRTSPEDHSQQMLNALLPGTQVPIHRHPNSNENVILLTGRMEEILYEEVACQAPGAPGQGAPQHPGSQGTAHQVRLREVGRIHLCPAEGRYGCQVPKGVWHTVEVVEPSVIYEGKDGPYGGDGSETFEAYQARQGASS